MIRTFRYPLRPTKSQEDALDHWRAACCELYNAALQERRDAWRKQRKSITYYDQQKELTELRASDLAWRDIPVAVERSALLRLDKAFAAFFQRVKRGQMPGFPRFRSHALYNSFDLNSDMPRVASNRVFLPKLGWVRFHKYRDMRGLLRHVDIIRTPRGWYVSFVCDLEKVLATTPVNSSVGVDVGLEVFATLSDGHRVENPRFFRRAEKALACHQRTCARKRRDSATHQRAKLLVARAHMRVRHQRLDFARKLACLLFERFDLVVHERLDISSMAHGWLSKSIGDAAWGLFLRCLALKAENAGKHCIAVNPRCTSQACAACGVVVKKPLSEREHRCDCGFVTHRDHNAALNILARGLRAGQLTEAV